MTAPYRDERFNWRAAENVVVVLFLILFSEGLFQRLISPVASADGSPLLRQLWLPAYGFAIAMSAFHWRALLQICLRAPFLILLVLLTLASAAWSIDPGITLRRSVALICTTWFGLYLAARYTWPDLLRLFGWAWLIVAAANLIAALAAPGIAVDHATHAGAWMGLYPEKNALGGVMARASFLFGILLLADERHRKAWALGLALCVLLVLMSTSKTALLATILGAVAIGAGILVKRSAVLAIGTVWAGVMAVVAIAAALVLIPDTVFGLLGRDASLTGRTDIWAALMRSIEARPWLGYGYGAFWGADSQPAYWVRVAVEWSAPTAHNGWLELLLAVGVAGLILFAIDFAGILMRACVGLRRGWGALFAAGFLLQFALISISESVIIQQNSNVWLMYAAIAGRLALDARARGRERSAQDRFALA